MEKCWRCGNEIPEGAEVCPSCRTDQRRVMPITDVGRGLRKLYDHYGPETVLSNPMLLPNGIGDVIFDTLDNNLKRFKGQLRMAMDAGMGRMYLEQLHIGSPDSSFDSRVRHLLTEDAGLSDKIAADLMGYFDEMIGWRAVKSSIPTVSPEQPKKEIPPTDPPKKKISALVPLILAIFIAGGVFFLVRSGQQRGARTDTATEMGISTIQFYAGQTLTAQAEQNAVIRQTQLVVHPQIWTTVQAEQMETQQAAESAAQNVAATLEAASAAGFIIQDGVLVRYTGSASSVVIPYGVTSIGSYAFSQNKTITSVEIPDTVTSIGESAFIQTNLTSVFFSENLLSIGSYAFSDTALTSVEIPDSVTTIGSSAFRAPGLASVKLPKALKTIGSYAFNETSLTSVGIPDGVTLIGDGAFSSTKLTSVWIPGSVKTIGNFAFAFIDDLTSVSLEPGLETIGENAFCWSENLSSVNIPSTVTSIGAGAFHGTAIRSIAIPYGVTSIGDKTFWACDNLQSVTIPSTVTSIGVEAFYDCSSLTSVTIPEGVTYVGEGAFQNCESMTYLSIPSSLSRIEKDTFYRCESLTSVTIPDGVIYIGECAFWSCNNLSYVSLPESVTYLGKWSFDHSGVAMQITIPANVTYIGDGALSSLTARARVRTGSYAESWCREHYINYTTY